MASITDDKLNKLIDKISKLTIALENMPIGEGHGRNDMFPFWRMNNKYDSSGSKKWKDLTSEERGDYERAKKDLINTIDEQIEKQNKFINKLTTKTNQRKADINNERSTIGRKLADPKLLLSERKKYYDRLKELDDEEKDLRKALNEEIKKEHKLRKKRNDTASKSTSEFYGEQFHSGPKEGTKKAWRRLTDEERSEFGSFDAYREQAVRNRATSNRQSASRLIYENNMGDTAFGRYAQRNINFRQRIDDYANMGRILQGSGGKRIATAMFGGGKMGATATKALGGFGKALTSVTKVLGRFAGPIGVAITALQMFAEGLTGHWEHQAKLADIQRKSEENQFNRSKQLTLKEQELKVENINFTADLNKKVQEVYSQNLLDAVGIENQAYLAGHSARMGTMMNGITDTAYAAAENSIDIATQIEKLDIDMALREAEKSMFEQSRGLQNEAKQNIVEAEKQQIDAEAKATQRELNQDLREYAHQTEAFGLLGPDVGGIVKTVEGFEADAGGDNVNQFSGQQYTTESVSRGEAVKGMAVNNPIGKLLGADDALKAADAHTRSLMNLDNQRLKQDKEYNKVRLENEFELKQTELDRGNEIKLASLQAIAEEKKARLDAAAALKKQYLALARQTEGIMEQVQQRSNDLAKNFGYTGTSSVNNFEIGFNKLGRDVFSKWGRSAEQAAALQTSYIESTGRNIQFSGKDYDKLMAVGNLVGDDGLAAELASTMEIFNHNAGDTMNMIEKSMQDVSKYGLNARKYSRDLVKNLQLASRYNFKGGTKGLMDMAKWAQLTRFNMDSLGSMLDKVQGGGIEGVITQSAGFQVLGGHAAINSDPLGMLYDAFADPQAYAKRMQDMTKGFGKFNEKTGETEFNINESMQINQLAKLQGRSAEEVRKEIMDRNKRTRIDKELNPYGDFTEQQKALVGSKAHLDENGEWVVTMDDNSEKKVRDLQSNDLRSLMPETHDEAVENYMQKILTAVDQLKGEQLFQQFDTMTEKWNEWLENVQSRLQSSHEDYLANRDELQKQITEGMTTATESFKHMMQVANDGNSAIDSATGTIKAAADNIGAELNNVALIIASANQELNNLLANPLTLSSNANNLSRGTERTTERLALDRVNSQRWLGSSAGEEWNDDHYTENAVGIMEALSGNRLNVSKLAEHYTDISGIDGLEEDGYRSTDSPQEILANFRELYLQGKIDERGNAVSRSAVNERTYLNSPFGQRLERAIRNASYFTELNYDAADNESEVKDLLNNISSRSNYNFISAHDGVMSADGKPMLVSARQVTSVQDGTAQVAKTDPNDTALFAKSGGPFDKLFDGIFGRVNTIYNEVVSNRFGGDVRSASTNSVSNVYDGSSLVSNRFGGDAIASPTEVQLTINGKIELTGQNGQSIDIMDTLRNNPMFVRQITEMIVLQMNNNTHGGRNELFHNRFSG